MIIDTQLMQISS